MAKIVASLLCVALLVSCVTMADYNFSRINKNIASGDFMAVYNELEKPSGMLYSSRDKVLRNFDKGIVLHYAGKWSESNKYFAEAERLMDQYKAKSVSQTLGSVITNDTVTDYAGGLYEDIYANIFMAMNYIQLKKYEDAFVEIRRIDIKLKDFSVKYRTQLEKAKSELASNAKSVPSGKIVFNNSALARYLSMLMYRTEQDYSNATLDYKFIKQAFSEQKSIYDFKIPSCVEADSTAKASQTRLNIVSFAGLGPEKKEVSTPLFAVDGLYRIALPVMTKRNSSITGVKITATNKKTGKTYTATGEKIESLENIITDTYQGEYALIVSRTIGRMVAKLTTTIALDAAAKQTSDSGLYLLFSVAGLISKVNMFASERADVRMCRYLPKNAYISSISVPDGTYDVKVEYKKGNSTISTSEFKNQAVKGGALNLIESCCLK